MYQPNYEGIAHKIVRECARVQEDEGVVIIGRADSLSYCELIALECHLVGALPLITVASDEYNYRVVMETPLEFLRKAPRHVVALARASDLVISVGMQPQDPRRFADVPEERVGAQRIGNKPVTDAILQTEGVRWLGTGYPTPQQAEMYGVPFEAFFETYWRAMDVDYSQLQARVARVAAVFEKSGQVRITSPKGTDLTLSVEGRPALKDDGVIHEKALNLPSGEVCFAPLESSAHGTVVFDLAFYRGHKIEDLVVRFEDGKAIPIEAKAGFDIFTDVLAHSHGAKDVIGELGIGLNEQIRQAIGYMLTDEKIMGTVHIALGENRFMGGVNESDLHWDLLILDPRVMVGDTLLMEGGEFLVG
ncbi:MAG: aminopeptidase [Anaerolineae bacterium]